MLWYKAAGSWVKRNVQRLSACMRRETNQSDIWLAQSTIALDHRARRKIDKPRPIIWIVIGVYRTSPTRHGHACGP